MPTLLPPPTVGTRLGAAALTVLTAAGATWIATPTALAAPGDGADIRIHREQVPFGVSKDDPVVCRFYLDAANFGELPTVAYTIKARPPAPTSATVTGSIELTQGAGHTDTLGLAEGSYTLEWTITPVGGAAPVPSPKVKIFKVSCHEDRREGNQDPNRPIGEDGRQAAGMSGPGGDGGQGGRPDQAGGQGGRPDQAGGQGGERSEGGGEAPKGGVHAGGGGLVDTVQAYTPLSAAAAVGLVVVSGAVYFRLLRRRSHGAA